MTSTPPSAPLGPLTPHLYVPDAARAMHAKRQRLSTATRVVTNAM